MYQTSVTRPRMHKAPEVGSDLPAKASEVNQTIPTTPLSAIRCGSRYSRRSSPRKDRRRGKADTFDGNIRTEHTVLLCLGLVALSPRRGLVFRLHLIPRYCKTSLGQKKTAWVSTRSVVRGDQMPPPRNRSLRRCQLPDRDDCYCA